jgi:hypothetical protein
MEMEMGVMGDGRWEARATCHLYCAPNRPNANAEWRVVCSVRCVAFDITEQMPHATATILLYIIDSYR